MNPIFRFRININLLSMVPCTKNKASTEDTTNKDDDAYESILTSNGYSVSVIPTLTFKFKNLNALLQKLTDMDHFSGLLLSSPRCVEAVAECWNNPTLSSASWERLKCFVVGEATSKAVEAKLNLKNEGSIAGNMSALFSVVNTYELDKPLLMPCGSLNKVSAEEACIPLEKIEVYETIENPNLEENLMRVCASSNSKESIAVFFSPSGLRFAQPYLKKYAKSKLKYVAIGETTSKELTKHGIKVDTICEKPNPQSLLKAISGMYNQN